ncbi:hypothetical protein AB8880_10070 [Alphaproteobacteria bacterium LSUCC0684]
MTFEELRDIFIAHGAKEIAERDTGVLIEFMTYTLFIVRPMNGIRYDNDELRHNLASYRHQTDGEVYTDYTSIFTWNGNDK